MRRQADRQKLRETILKDPTLSVSHRRHIHPPRKDIVEYYPSTLAPLRLTWAQKKTLAQEQATPLKKVSGFDELLEVAGHQNAFIDFSNA